MLPQFTAEYRDLKGPKGHESPRILWIDDEIRVTDPCVRLLELEGYRVECVASGADALIKIEHAGYDGIILDLRLQDEFGLDVLDALRAFGLRSPVLVLTGWADWESGVAAMKRGAWDYRSKTTMLTGEWLKVVKAMVTLEAHEPTFVGQLERLAAAAPTNTRPDDQGHTGSRDLVAGALLAALTKANLTLPVFLAIAASLRRVLAAPPAESIADRCAMACRAIKRATLENFTCKHPKVKEALAQLEAHPQRWAEEDLARAIGVSASHFGRVVHNDTGLSYRDLRRAATLKPAIREILLTDEQVAQIGLRLGFRHASQFAREVHETFGLSPRMLRRLWRRIEPHHR